MSRRASYTMFYLIAGTVAAVAAYRYFFDRDDKPPSPQTYEPSQPPVPRRDERQTIETSHRHITPGEAGYESSRARARRASRPPVPRHDERESIETSHRDHVIPEEGYESFRARAREEGDLMSSCYRQSEEAYERRDHARAKALSDEAKRHRLNMERLDAKASATKFKENNRNRDPWDVDLHGLYVKEAIAYSERALSDARQSGRSEIRLIVGQGSHSEGGVSKLKPALHKDMEERGHRVEVDPRNPGVLIVQLGGQ